MNKAAEFVYRVAAKNDRRRVLWSVAGALFWYGAVAIMILLAPIVDRAIGIRMAIPLALRLPLGIILLLVGVPTVVWTIIRFLRTKGSPIPFNPPPALVVNGLYRIVRNPMHPGWTVLLYRGSGAYAELYAAGDFYSVVYNCAYCIFKVRGRERTGKEVRTGVY